MSDRRQGGRAGERPHGPAGDADPTRDDPPPGGPERDEPAPFLGSWPLLYAVVFLNLVALIALFTWFTRAFE